MINVIVGWTVFLLSFLACVGGFATLRPNKGPWGFWVSLSFGLLGLVGLITVVWAAFSNWKF